MFSSILEYIAEYRCGGTGFILINSRQGVDTDERSVILELKHDWIIFVMF